MGAKSIHNTSSPEYWATFCMSGSDISAIRSKRAYCKQLLVSFKVEATGSDLGSDGYCLLGFIKARRFPYAVTFVI